MTAWPASLPQRPLAEPYFEEPEDLVLRSSMDVGPSKTRLRSTAGTEEVPFHCNLTRAQIKTFKSFLSNQISMGALPFNITHPREEVTVSVMLKGSPPYRLTPIGNGHEYFRLAMSLEIQP